MTVFELSSYQCHDLPAFSQGGGSEGPSVAVLLDLFPEHMDWHGRVEDYYRAKLHLPRSQGPGDRFFFHPEAEAAWRALGGEPFATLTAAEATAVHLPEGLHFAAGWFRRGRERLFPDTAMALAGLHNRRNAVSALAAAEALGAGAEHLARVLKDFHGLPHRLENLGVHGGLRWIDDSISTAPEAAAAALEALHRGGRPASALIAGGLDRGYDFTPLARAAESYRLEWAFLTGESAESLARALEGTGAQVEIVQDLAAAVELARERVPSGGTCLLSPASPSYGSFTSFEERGRLFRELVTGGAL